MDMSMDGMGMNSSDNLLRNVNEPLARDFWFIIASVVGVMLLFRIFEKYENRSRLKSVSQPNVPEYPTRPQNVISRVYATVTAIGREISYPQLSFNAPFTWLSPPPLGRSLFLICYGAMVTYMLTHNAIIYDSMYYETIAFRAAWISLTQVPLVYLLSSKANTVSFLVGSSYERLNWLHRWVSRTLLISVTVHGGFFVREWLRAGPGFFQLEMALMKMVTWGFAAWGILVWMFLSSLWPVRNMAYELFVLQHILSAAFFLWVLWAHVPRYAEYFVRFSVAAFSFDWALRLVLLCYRNFSFSKPRYCVGYQAYLGSDGQNITTVTLKDVQLSWKPGQHVRVWIPRLGPFETHPFTMANQSRPISDISPREMRFVIDAQGGISRRLYKYSQKRQREDTTATLRVFISGPCGTPPNWNAYETLVLIAASTGASFTVPILESALMSSKSSCVQRIRFLLFGRKRSGVNAYVPALLRAISEASELGLDLSIDVAITAPDGMEENSILISEDVFSLEGREGNQRDVFHEDMRIDDDSTEKSTSRSYVKLRQSSISDNQAPNTISQPQDKEQSAAEASQVPSDFTLIDVNGDGFLLQRRIRYSTGRPDISEYIRSAVEVTGGETTVAVCGGRSLVSSVRNKVASLSNERAVHKGTGAQGIHVFSEDYSI